MLVPNSTSTVSLLSAKGRDILTSLGSPSPEMASEGQDRADALGWGRRPNRPKTFARNHTIPHKSYRCFYLRKRPGYYMILSRILQMDFAEFYFPEGG